MSHAKERHTGGAPERRRTSCQPWPTRNGETISMRSKTLATPERLCLIHAKVLVTPSKIQIRAGGQQYALVRKNTSCGRTVHVRAQISLADDCSADLKPDITEYNENISVWLSYLSILNQNQSSNNSASAGLSYDGVGLSLGDANTISQYITDKTNYTIDEQQSIRR
jgi:hypothetical protein